MFFRVLNAKFRPRRTGGLCLAQTVVLPKFGSVRTFDPFAERRTEPRFRFSNLAEPEPNFSERVHIGAFDVRTRANVELFVYY